MRYTNRKQNKTLTAAKKNVMQKPPGSVSGGIVFQDQHSFPAAGKLNYRSELERSEMEMFRMVHPMSVGHLIIFPPFLFLATVW